MKSGRRQFIICDKKINRNDFEVIDLQNGYFLNYHKDLSIKRIGDNILIGLAFSIDPNYPVTENTRYPIEEQMKKWGGRFLVYSQGIILPDATNSLGVYYYKQEETKLVSSSIQLMVEEYDVQRKDEFELDFRPGSGATWDYYPGPYTPYISVKRLMQYEYIDLNTEQFIVDKKMEWNPIYKEMSPEELTERLIQYSTHMLREIAKEYDGIWVPLTGGVDSRCVSAMCKKADIPFATYTEQRTKKTHGVGLSDADRKLPKKVSKLLDVKWYYTKRKPWNEEKWNDILKHSMGMVRNTNLYSYAYDQYPKGAKRNIILHGSVFEISREYYKRRMSVDCTDIEEQLKILRIWLNRNMSRSQAHKESIESWIKDIHRKGNMDMFWGDRFYYEQRIGSWLSSLNQAMDIIDFDRISPASNYEIISILMAYPREMRRKS